MNHIVKNKPEQGKVLELQQIMMHLSCKYLKWKALDESGL